MLDLGYSFCPNDTFIFYALTHGKIPLSQPIQEVLEDVETLNQWALTAKLPITKISYRAYAAVREQYVALRSGGALGRGVGPLVVHKHPLSSLQHKVVASPGALTTAESLLRLFEPRAIIVRMRYDQIMPAVLRGEVDAGLIIHESRFTYAEQGLHKYLDLGAWWEEDTLLPLPLGAILVRRDVAKTLQQEIGLAVRHSLEYAYQHPQEPKVYIRQHALEMSDAVMQAHIDLYVNNFSLNIGNEGERAVETLFAKLEQAGMIEKSRLPLFTF